MTRRSEAERRLAPKVFLGKVCLNSTQGVAVTDAGVIVGGAALNLLEALLSHFALAPFEITNLGPSLPTLAFDCHGNAPYLQLYDANLHQFLRSVISLLWTLILMVPPARFQRATFRLGGGRSMQLSYGSTRRMVDRKSSLVKDDLPLLKPLLLTAAHSLW